MRTDETVDVPDVFADSVRFAMSPYAFTMEFGLQPLPDVGVFPVEGPTAVARVRVSPQLAYAMRELLTSNIEAYEQQIGKITLPTAFIFGAGSEG